MSEAVDLLCDEETTAEERATYEAAYEASKRLGEGLNEAHRMAEELAKHLSQLHHEYWHTPSEEMLLHLVADARHLRDNIMGWQD